MGKTYNKNEFDKIEKYKKIKKNRKNKNVIKYSEELENEKRVCFWTRVAQF